MICFINKARVDPEILQAVFLGLFFIKLDLLIAMLILAHTLCQVFKGDLLIIGPLYVRKYCIVWDYIIAGKFLGKAELASFAS
jgi:hypothetical protein